MISLTILADSNALFAKETAPPRCVKIDECSCRLKNVAEPGLINLHGLVNDKHEPRFVTEGESKLTGRIYSFYYNPCMNFSDMRCPNTSICQKHTYDYKYYFYDLGNADTAEFQYQNNSVVILYKSKSQNIDDINRTSEVELVCDETEVLGRFEFIGEPVQAHYKFKLYTQCACPGKCKATKIECVGQDLCTCEMSDGTGTVNLQSLNNPLSPMMKDQPSLNQTIFYNPCSPVANPNCGSHSICEIRNGSIMGLGYASSARFVSKRRLGIEYESVKGKSTVNLICDYSQRDEAKFRVDIRATNTYIVRSMCACPDGCDTPGSPPISSCDQIDPCTCKSYIDDVTINLHDLDNPYGPLTTTDGTDYTYYYNPCSGIQIKVEDKGFKCQDVAGCQFDPYADGYYNIGQIVPEIDYNATAKEFTFHYSNGEASRSFDVRMVCDPKADTPALATDGDIPHGVTFYPLKLITKLACF